ncbi:MAG: TatD family hydrolase [Thiohalomonadaceae bacterium]
MELIDTHCHIDVEEFAADRAQVLARARAAGVVRQVVPAIHQPGWAFLRALCRREADLLPALGMHPIYLDVHRPEHLMELRGLLASERPVAVGEIGLDYFVTGLDRAVQQELFEAQLRLAAEFALPVLLHVRKAHDQVLATLRRMKFRHGGIAHAFSGSAQQAEQYLDLGFKLGFGGTLTYARSSRIRALARELPLAAIVLETDAPDIVTVAHRGERNSPEYLPEVLAALAEVRGADPAVLASATTANARAVLRL